MPFNLFPFSFMVKLNIGPVREDHVVTANPDQIFLYLDMRYRDVPKIEKEIRDYEIKLDNGLEMTFDLKGNLIDIDD